MLNIPAKYPDHTKTWLTFIDATCQERALAEHTTKLDQATALLNHADGNTAYFARLYLGLPRKGGAVMTYDQWKTTDRSLYYDEPEEEERLEWDDMEPLNEDDDEFFPDMEALVAAAEQYADYVNDR